MKPLRVEEKRLRTSDGADLAYRVVGEGPWIVLCSGLGGGFPTWTPLVTHLLDRYRLLSWDYRGLFDSGPPPSPDAIRVADHARDALALCDAEGIRRAAFFGWSMGVQVALEVFRAAPDRVAALMLMNGVAGRPWENPYDTTRLRRVIRPVAKGLLRTPRLLQRLTRRVIQWPETGEWVKRIGLAGRTLDEELFDAIAGSFEKLDLSLWLRTFLLLGEHDASDIVRDVDVPTLVVAGDRDVFTPRNAMEALVREIPGAELMVVPGGTHYVLLEVPDLVNLRIEKFLIERGYAPAPSAESRA
jgi:pimeloyl-ACP methyl ester carboxylesterase